MASDLHGWYADGEEQGHSQVYPALPPSSKPCVDQAITLSGLPKACCPKYAHGAIHHTCHPCMQALGYLEVQCINGSFTVIDFQLSCVVEAHAGAVATAGQEVI